MMWDELSQASLDEIVAWAENQPWCRAMAECQQDAGWHSEGMSGRIRRWFAPSYPGLLNGRH